MVAGNQCMTYTDARCGLQKLKRKQVLEEKSTRAEQLYKSSINNPSECIRERDPATFGGMSSKELPREATMTKEQT
ncbi:hypothetical protein GX48_06836 [Paracoccidioides brasiliensis]|nr:hypothetical protein GX48_06836 [Paracoccidioides brasiliensis]